MSNVLRPMPALTPVLIAKYHISFYDAIGRAPRVLDYNCFVNYNVMSNTTYLNNQLTYNTGVQSFLGRIVLVEPRRILGQRRPIPACQCQDWNPTFGKFVVKDDIAWIPREYVYAY